MKATDVMTSNVISVGPGAMVRDIAEMMLTHGISGVPVLGEGGELLVTTQAASDRARRRSLSRRRIDLRAASGPVDDEGQETAAVDRGGRPVRPRRSCAAADGSGRGVGLTRRVQVWPTALPDNAIPAARIGTSKPTAIRREFA
jgi:CBS domain-containing protein